MQDNFMQMTTEISTFLIANFIFMLVLLIYRKVKPGSTVPYLKICFIFAALCFTSYVTFKHSGIDCEDLNEYTKCQCYALELKHSKSQIEKSEWSKKGQEFCPDSTYFTSSKFQTPADKTLNRLKKFFKKYQIVVDSFS